MKKMIISMLLLVSALAAQAAVKTVQFRGLAYSVDTERQEAKLLKQSVTIKGDLPIPEEIQYKDKASGNFISVPVTTIAKNALAGQKKLKSLYIPASVQKIGGYAFADCRRLRLVYFASAQMGAEAGNSTWLSGTKAVIKFDLMPGESVSLQSTNQ